MTTTKNPCINCMRDVIDVENPVLRTGRRVMPGVVACFDCATCRRHDLELAIGRYVLAHVGTYEGK